MLSVLALALAVAAVRGGDLGAFGRQRWRWPALPFAAIVVQVIAFLPDERASAAARTFAAALHVLSYALALGFVLANRRVPWMAAIGVGLVLNAAAIVANGGFMPAAPEAIAGTPHDVGPAGPSNNSILMDGATRLRVFGDVFRTPGWLPIRRAFSLGDLLLMAGAFGLIQRLMLPRRPRPAGARAGDAR